MSMKGKKRTTRTLQKMKDAGEKISMLTCYDYTTAALIEQADIDMVLVGDSLGMTMLGYEDTLAVTMEDMIHHTAAVSRGLSNTFLLGDMPFMSYQTSDYDALLNAGRLMKEGHASGVKLEGGAAVASRIRTITDAGIPVCAHLGLTPQSVNAFGGFRVQGKTLDRAEELISDAEKIQEAGAFMVVLEGIPAELAAIITDRLEIPTIGIGAGAGCDGQVLVYQDMLAMSERQPKFVRTFAPVGEMMKQAFMDYDSEVKAQTFPGKEHTYAIPDEVAEELRAKYPLSSKKGDGQK